MADPYLRVNIEQGMPARGGGMNLDLRFVYRRELTPVCKDKR
jgi:hypothetical protein